MVSSVMPELRPILVLALSVLVWQSVAASVNGGAGSQDAPASGATTDDLRRFLLMLIPALAAAVMIWRLRLLRPRTVRLAADPDIRVQESRLWPVFLLGGLMIWLAQPLGAAAASGLFSVAPADRLALRGFAIVAWGSYLGAAIALGIVLLTFPGLTAPVGLRLRFRDVPFGVIGFALVYPIIAALGVLFMLIALWISTMTGGVPPDPVAHQTLGLLTDPLVARDGWWWATIGAVTIGAPVAEELVYRGFIQTSLLRLTGSPRLAVVLTSAAFVVPHVTVVEPHALPVLFALSLGLGTAFERTGRLGAPIMIHALFNAVNIAIAAG
ncbi:MAG TPA: type II CAAX endopeptidase family protein [Phycisphaerales bacterium]|nr:type II CAAX endopeptidase family protein [Phycisphaerales bacterium]